MSAGAVPFEPDPSLLAKLGSIIRHAEEAISDTGHRFDVAAVETLLEDPDVAEWMVAMDELGLLPVKR